MTESADLAGRLAGARPSVLTAFAVACGTRLTPVFGSFAQADGDRFGEWVARLWRCVYSPDAGQARALFGQIMSAPEDSVDDSNRPDYYAMRALGVLYHATKVFLDEDMIGPSRQSAASSLELLRGFDYILEIPPGSSGSLERLESRTQHEWLDRHAGADGVIGDDLAEEARTSAIAGRLAEAAPEIADLRGWDLTQWRSG